MALVWVTGFEPAASCSQSTRATKLRYTQSINCTQILKSACTFSSFVHTFNSE